MPRLRRRPKFPPRPKLHGEVVGRHVEVSGYHGANTRQVRAILDEHRDNPSVVLITGTENYNGQDDPAWRAPGWGYDRIGELSISWRLSVLELHVDVWKRPLSKRRWYRGNGQALDGLDSLVARFRTVATRRWITVRMAHMPSGVQEGGGWSRVLGRLRVYWSAMRTWKQIVRLNLRNRPTGVLIIVADWNLDHGRKWVRAYLRRYLKPLRPVLTGEGTLGSREIDVAWVWGANTGNARVHPRRPGIDHKATSYELEV